MRKILISMLACFIIGISNCYAVTDDVGVLAGLEENNYWYEYLNMYNYRTWLSDHRYLKHDMYVSQDDSVIVSLFDDRLNSIYILKKGYKTNKGIEVGMTANDMIYAYGKFSRGGNENGHLEGYGRDNYSGYYSVEYVSSSNEGLSFIIDRQTQIIAMIRYQKNRHGNSTAFADLDKYHFIPFKRSYY